MWLYVFHGNGSLFYTFTLASVEFHALSSYYLGSFLSPPSLLLICRICQMMFYLTILLKFGLIGLSSFTLVWIGFFKDIPNLLKLALSTSYALMSFIVSQLEIKNLARCFILIPLIITGLHLLITKKKFLFYKCVNLIYSKLLFWLYDSIVSYFSGISVKFLGTLKLENHSFLDFVVHLVLAGMVVSYDSSYSVWFTNSWREIDCQYKTKQIVAGIWIFCKEFIGSFDTTKYGAIPMIFVGLLPLFWPFYFYAEIY